MLELVPLGLFEGELFNNVNAFLLLMLTLSAVIGAFSGFGSIAGLGVFIVFVRIAVQADLWIFTSLLYVLATIVVLMMGIQAWGFINESQGGV